MITLLLKEIRSFFTSITGYVVIIVFLLANSAFIWLFPGDMNILDTGYATLDSFFTFAPWIFLFLVPAITMRSFAEETKSGTMESLLTKPVTNLQLVLAKYLGSLLLVLFSIIPCFIFYYSVNALGNPPGNIDTGGTWGAFIGLFLLAAIYTSIGIFASSITDNQIIAFILAFLISFFFYQGFDFIASMPLLQSADVTIMNLGINEHYKSISRGVLDSRDIIYYLIVIALFTLFTKTKLQSYTW